MIKFPLNPDARAHLLDGKYANVHSVVIDPARQSVLYFVIGDAAAQRWLLPLKYVLDADDELVNLRITSEEFNRLTKFDDSQFLLGEDAENDFFKASSAGGNPIFYVADLSEETLIPLEKDLALIRGAFVEASDGLIGTIEEIAVDPRSGYASQIIIHSHGRDKTETTLPVSLIERAEVDTVYLKISREEFEALPSVPVKYNRAGKIRYQMLAKIYGNTGGAQEAYLQWKQLWGKQTTRFIYSAAILMQDEQGNFSFSETADVDKRHGRLFGALAGGLVGLVGGPVGLVVGALAGAGVGGFTADKVDRGLSNHFINAFSEKLGPGSSALIILVDSEGVPAIEASLGKLAGVLVQEELTDEMLEKYSAESSND